MMNNNKKFATLSTYRNSYIVTWLLFTVVFAVCLFLFYFTATTFFPLTLVFAVIVALGCVLITCVRCAKANKIINPDGFNPPRDAVFYFKRMGFIIIMVYLMCMGVSFAGTFVSGIISGMLANNINLRDNLFLRGFIIKLPMFVIYLTFIYKMFIRYGFMDSQRKIYNLNLKMLAVAVSLILMTPTAVYDSMFYTSTMDTLIVNLQTVFSPNVDMIKIEDGFVNINNPFNENFSLTLVIFTLLLAFAIQASIAWFAYKRGKQIFIKQHIREIDYDMDENI